MQIGTILQEVISTLAPVAHKKQVELVLDNTVVSCELAGDAERLRQVFVNLVDNSVKFTPKGGRVTVQARVSDAAGDGEDDDGAVLLAPVRRVVEVTVADTGIGIPKAERARVFDAFYQVDSSSTREYGGTGLGLSIVKRIVDAHGGTVTVDSNDCIPPGTTGGTRFVVTLPSAQALRSLPSRVPPADRP
jgi:signal transduction histidine kinase